MDSLMKNSLLMRLSKLTKSECTVVVFLPFYNLVYHKETHWSMETTTNNAQFSKNVI